MGKTSGLIKRRRCSLLNLARVKHKKTKKNEMSRTALQKAVGLFTLYSIRFFLFLFYYGDDRRNLYDHEVTIETYKGIVQ